MKQKLALVKPPTFTLKMLTNFPLAKIELTFTVADFERPLKMRHVKKILDGILINEFFDIIISVLPRKNGQFEIIDGQHRVKALEMLRDIHGIKKYNLILMVFPEKFSRKIYRRINLGQPLKMEEHLRALDNNTHPFFTKLRPYCVHYNDGNRPKFEMILNALSYAKSGSPRAVRTIFLDRMFDNITTTDLKIITIFSKALRTVDPMIPKTHQPLYMFSVFRNMFRVGYENDFDQSDWENFMEICKEDQKIYKLRTDRSMDGIKEIYGHMIKHVGSQIEVEVVRKDRSLSDTRQAFKQKKPEFKPPIF